LRLARRFELGRVAAAAACDTMAELVVGQKRSAALVVVDDRNLEQRAVRTGHAGEVGDEGDVVDDRRGYPSARVSDHDRVARRHLPAGDHPGKAAKLGVRAVHPLDGETQRFGLEPERVRVIPHGIDRERFRPDGHERRPLLLYPAANQPHKNHARLLQAFSMLRRERPELRLVLVGPGHRAVHERDGVEVLGHVSLAELATLYATAAALVFPSLHETFGLPPLEAMARICLAVLPARLQNRLRIIPGFFNGQFIGRSERKGPSRRSPTGYTRSGLCEWRSLETSGGARTSQRS